MTSLGVGGAMTSLGVGEAMTSYHHMTWHMHHNDHQVTTPNNPKVVHTT